MKVTTRLSTVFLDNILQVVQQILFSVWLMRPIALDGQSGLGNLSAETPIDLTVCIKKQTPLWMRYLTG